MNINEFKKTRGRPRKYATKEESMTVNKLQIKEWFKTKEGRAYNLADNYKRMDKKHHRGESTITPKWIEENIFTSKCYWCGEDDWKQLGCDRIDNNKPHTPDNVICSCGRCNLKRNIHSFDYFTKFMRSLSRAGKQLTLF